MSNKINTLYLELINLIRKSIKSKRKNLFLHNPYFDSREQNYLKNYMKLDITFSSYINTIYYIISILLRTTGNFRQDLTKFVTLFLYVGIYLYNMYQTYEIAVNRLKLRGTRGTKKLKAHFYEVDNLRLLFLRFWHRSSQMND